MLVDYANEFVEAAGVLWTAFLSGLSVLDERIQLALYIILMLWLCGIIVRLVRHLVKAFKTLWRTIVPKSDNRNLDREFGHRDLI